MLANKDLGSTLGSQRKMNVTFNKQESSMDNSPNRKKDKTAEKVKRKGQSAKFSLDDFANQGVDEFSAAEMHEQRMVYINKWRGRDPKYREDTSEYHHTPKYGNYKLNRNDRIQDGLEALKTVTYEKKANCNIFQSEQYVDWMTIAEQLFRPKIQPKFEEVID